MKIEQHLFIWIGIALLTIMAFFFKTEIVWVVTAMYHGLPVLSMVEEPAREYYLVMGKLPVVHFISPP